MDQPVGTRIGAVVHTTDLAPCRVSLAFLARPSSTAYEDEDAPLPPLALVAIRRQEHRTFFAPARHPPLGFLSLIGHGEVWWERHLPDPLGFLAATPASFVRFSHPQPSRVARRSLHHAGIEGLLTGLQALLTGLQALLTGLARRAREEHADRQMPLVAVATAPLTTTVGCATATTQTSLLTSCLCLLPSSTRIRRCRVLSLLCSIVALRQWHGYGGQQACSAALRRNCKCWYCR